MSRPKALAAKQEQIWPEVLEALAKGGHALDIAAKHGISPRTLQHWVMLDEQADQARAGYFAHEMSKAYDELDNAQNGLELAKAKEKLAHLRHIAETRARRYFGKEAQIQINMLSGDQAITRIRQLEQELGYTKPPIEHIQG